MITILNSHSGIQVSNQTTPPYVNMSNPSAGMLRYNGTNVEVYDGNSWLSMNNSRTIELDPRVKRIVDWAEKKMYEEQDLLDRMERHPGLKDAWEKFKVMDALTGTERRQHDFGEVQAGP